MITQDRMIRPRVGPERASHRGEECDRKNKREVKLHSRFWKLADL